MRPAESGTTRSTEAGADRTSGVDTGCGASRPLCPKRRQAIAIRGGAHSVAGFSSCDDGIVIDVARLNEVQVDVESRLAFAGGGTICKAFNAATQQHGLRQLVG